MPTWLKGRRTRSDADLHLDRHVWTLRDRSGTSTVLDPLNPVAVKEAIAALKTRRKPVKVTLVVSASRCFLRHTALPRALLGHARSILTSELETTTPFHAGNTHWDWFVAGEGAEPGTLAVTQVVLKRRDTEGIALRLADAGIPIAAIAVEDGLAGGTQRLPVDLQRNDREGTHDPAGLRGARKFVAGAAVLACLAIVPAGFSRQSTTLAALDQEISDATDAVATRPGLARAPLQALGEALRAKRNLPPATAILNGLATALPSGSSLDHVFLDKDVMTIQGRTTSVHALERALSGSPLFAAGHNTAPPSAGTEGAAFTIRLKIKPIPTEPDA